MQGTGERQGTGQDTIKASIAYDYPPERQNARSEGKDTPKMETPGSGEGTGIE